MRHNGFDVVIQRFFQTGAVTARDGVGCRRDTEAEQQSRSSATASLGRCMLCLAVGLALHGDNGRAHQWPSGTACSTKGPGSCPLSFGSMR